MYLFILAIVVLLTWPLTMIVLARLFIKAAREGVFTTQLRRPPQHAKPRAPRALAGFPSALAGAAASAIGAPS